MKKMRKLLKRRWVIVLLIILLLVGVTLWRRSASSKTSSAIATTVVKQTDFVKTISSSGKTKANQSVELTFQTAGKLAWVGVKEGDMVYAYQAIASLDAREVQINLEKALRDYSKQRNDFEQTWRVTYDGKKVTDTVTDTVKRILEKNQWDLEKAVMDVELKHIVFEYATLVTPIGGIVTRIDAPIAGVNVTPTNAVFAIANPQSMVFEANVDETDIGNLTIGQMATIELDAFPDKTFPGTISYISYISEQSSGGATVFSVKITFDETQNIRIGLNGDITFQISSVSGALTIPLEAIREDKTGKYVYKKDNRGYQKTPVTVGPQSETEAVVTEGLNVDDTIVTKGFNNIPKSQQ